MDASKKPTKDLRTYIAEVQERDNFKAMSDEELCRLKQIIDDEQVRRRVVVVISDIANSLK
jgi:hypothetical protein